MGTTATASAWAGPIDTRTNEQIWADFTEADLRRIYWGAWNATDRGNAHMAKQELIRRGLSIVNMEWPRMDISTWVSY